MRSACSDKLPFKRPGIGDAALALSFGRAVGRQHLVGHAHPRRALGRRLSCERVLLQPDSLPRGRWLPGRWQLAEPGRELGRQYLVGPVLLHRPTSGALVLRRALRHRYVLHHPRSGCLGLGRRNLGDRGPSSQPTGVDALLNALSCPTTTTCVLVGATTPNSSCNPQHCTLPHFRSLAEVWNGAVWSIEQVPGGKCSTVECRVDILRAVSCAGAMTCIGVGRGVTASWNGTAWANEPPLPDPISQRRPGTPGAGTSCVRTRLCLGRFRGLCRDRRQ